jgi:uroporphyrinogen decarboxylase
MDIRVVREKYPDWLLMGNVQCSLLQDTDEPKIREAVRYCMRYGGVGKRYIFSTSNCIFAGMPPASYRLMFEEYQTILRKTS